MQTLVACRDLQVLQWSCISLPFVLSIQGLARLSLAIISLATVPRQVGAGGKIRKEAAYTRWIAPAYVSVGPLYRDLNYANKVLPSLHLYHYCKAPFQGYRFRQVDE